MRILHCIASIDNAYGGPAVAARGLCGALQEKGLRIALLTGSSGNHRRDQEHKSLLPGVDIFWSRPLVKRYRWDPSLSALLKSKLKQFDAIHVHGLFNGLSIDACHAARVGNKPYLLEPFGTLSDYCLQKNKLFKNISLGLIERKNIESASAVRFSSSQECGYALKNFKIKNYFVLNHGVDEREFAALPARGPFRKKWNIPDADRLVLFMGRLQPIKGLEVFLRAFLRWKKTKSEKWMFAIVGMDEAGYKKKLGRLLGPQEDTAVFFTGPLFGREKLEALTDADVFVLPSFHENFGLAAAEAMGCGKPVLVSDQVGIAGAVKDLVLGIVAAPTGEGLAAGLEEMANKRNEWQTMGERGRLWVKTHCQWSQIADEMVSQYARMIQQTR